MKRRRTLYVLLFIFAAILLTTETLARFYNKTEGTTNLQIAPWVVKVNGDNIAEKKTITTADIEWDKNEAVVDGKIAPGQKGKIKLQIDPTGSKVAMDIKVTLETHDTFVILENPLIKGLNNSNITNQNGIVTITGSLDLNDVKTAKKVDLELPIKWDYHVSDAQDGIDTKTGETVASLNGDLIVEASQKI